MTEIDWAHRDMLRGWAILAARGHAAAQAVASYHGLVPPPVLPPAPAPARATVPRAPRPVVPTAPQPATPALSGVQRRVDMLTRLVSPPKPPDELV
jgi:hypothetical protein